MNADSSDYTGMKFHSWTVVRFDRCRYVNRCKFWICRCDCGAEKSQTINVLKTGRSKSCGHSPTLIHGMARNGHRAPEYRAWEQLKQRCLNPNGISYPRYGGRGIEVCEGIDRRPTSIKALIGNRPNSSMSIDRKANDGHYSCGSCDQCIANKWPMNIRWATKKEQAQNRSNSSFVIINGVKKAAADAAREIGLSLSSIHRRLKSGRTGKELLLPPRHKGGRPSLSRI